MNNPSFIRRDFLSEEWTLSREKVYRKNVEIYYGIKASIVKLIPGHAAWLHSHATEQNVFVLSGSGYIEIEKIKYELSKHCIVSVPSWAEHKVVADTEELIVLSLFQPTEDLPETTRPVPYPEIHPYVFNFDEKQWECVREKVKRKVYQGSENFTFSYVQLDENHEPRPHDHADIQIVFTLNNKTTYYIGDEGLELHKGVMIASAPWVRHNSHNTFDAPVTDFEIFWPKRNAFKEAKDK